MTPTTEVFVIVTDYGIRYAGGTHSTRGSFFLTKKGATDAARGWYGSPGRVLRGTITWESE